jgi:hypothetical protein
MMSVVALRTAEPHRAVISDAGGTERSLRVTWHAEDELFAVTFWEGRLCVASVRVSLDDAADVLVVLAEGLSEAVPEWVLAEGA